jgi:hypothetical protein
VCQPDVPRLVSSGNVYATATTGLHANAGLSVNLRFALPRLPWYGHASGSSSLSNHIKIGQQGISPSLYVYDPDGYRVELTTYEVV